MYNASLVYIYTPDYLNHCMNWDEYTVLQVPNYTIHA